MIKKRARKTENGNCSEIRTVVSKTVEGAGKREDTENRRGRPTAGRGKGGRVRKTRRERDK